MGKQAFHGIIIIIQAFISIKYSNNKIMSILNTTLICGY